MALWFRQLLMGRDLGRRNPTAGQMANFVYLIGDTERRECVVVDPAWDISGLLDLLDEEEMKLIGALVTHYHPDHCGGEIFGISIEGIAELLEKRPVKIWVNRKEAEGLKMITGASESDLVRVESGETMNVGGVTIRFLHTPGHTPGSQCFLVGNRLVSGDTLFIGGCGRVDLPGANPDEMYESLTQKLAKLPEETLLFPGHHYADRPVSTIGEEKRTNQFLQIPSLEAWRRIMGPPPEGWR
ncbi:MAG: MBL fold metallo-hydrolase [Deltaproteobacteria bacterium]|nr:MAG: MBL fold metallo-hydrolase [Deltaproteobacteria bacterium]